MRPLAIDRIGSANGALTAVDGVAMVRGAPVPVVDARKLLGVPGEPATRFVIVRIAQRRVALAVDAVLDVRTVAADALPGLPPLLRTAQREVVSAIGALDAELLIVLDSARVLSEDAWCALEAAGKP